MKRLCFVVSTDATAKVFLLDQIRALSQRYRVSVVANTNDCEFLKREQIAGDVIQVPIERKLSLLRDARAFVILWVVFRRNRFDAIHSVTPKAGLLAMLAGAFAGVRHRTHMFTGQVWVTRSGLSRALLKSVDCLVARLATSLMADSHSQRQFLARQGVASEDRIRVLGAGSISGVDVNRFRPDEDGRSSVRKELEIPDRALVFLFVGRLTRDKGVLDLAVAFAGHSASGAHSYLMIVGPDEEGVSRRMREVLGGVANRVRFVGLTARPERYMAASDVLCLPSYREGFGAVVIEAAAVGLPAIASNIYGIVDAVQAGRTGLLHEPRDTAALARAMDRLAAEPEFRRCLAERGRARALSEFSRERVTSEMVHFYASELGDGEKVARGM